jgi:type IV secretion system protein VirB8
MSAIGRGDVFDRQSYYADAQSWSADVVANLRRSRKRAWLLAGVSSATSLIAVTALALLTPLKTAVPYVIELERSTGYVQEARTASPGTLSENETVRQSNIYHYVLARETIDASDIAANYDKTVAWSADAARAGYLALWDKASPDSLVGRYPLGTVVSVSMKGISPLGPNTALVRFATLRTPPGGREPAVENWQAIVRYRYADRPLSQAERFINPLGFQVTSYRRDPDAPPLPAVPATLARSPRDGANS